MTTHMDQGPADERYRRLIEQSRLGLFQTARDGEVLWVNAAAADIVGYDSPEEFIASVPDIRQIYIDPARRADFQTAIDTYGFVNDFEYEIRRKDGSQRWISVSAIQMLDSDGNLEGFEGTVYDITERKLMEASVAAISSELEPVESIGRFAEVLRRVIPFEQLSLAVVDGDHYRRIVSISASGETPSLPRGEWVPLAGNSMSLAVETRKPVVVQDTSAGEWEFDARLRAAGVLSYSVFPLVRDDNVVATFNIGIGERDAFTDEVVGLLSKHTSAVEHAVNNLLLYESQREVLGRLQELDRLKNQFFAEVSHDLRHPLTVVLGISAMLEKDWAGIDDPRRKDLVGVIVRSAQNLSELLERDLDLALIESGELRYEIGSFDLGEVVGDIGRSFGEAHSKRPMDIVIPVDLPLALGDPRRQGQILRNLLSNADKFSPPGRAIRVIVAAGDNELSVSVIDEGPGIEEDKKEGLFGRLARLGSAKPGTGLGLYIARSMVEAQGGRIWLADPGGRGSCFVYTVPAAPADTTRTA